MKGIVTNDSLSHLDNLNPALTVSCTIECIGRLKEQADQDSKTRTLNPLDRKIPGAHKRAHDPLSRMMPASERGGIVSAKMDCRGLACVAAPEEAHTFMIVCPEALATTGRPRRDVGGTCIVPPRRGSGALSLGAPARRCECAGRTSASATAGESGLNMPRPPASGFGLGLAEERRTRGGLGERRQWLANPPAGKLKKDSRRRI
jgi:hypothetical protein